MWKLPEVEAVRRAVVAKSEAAGVNGLASRVDVAASSNGLASRADEAAEEDDLA